MANAREIHFYPKSKLLAVFDLTTQGRVAVYVIEAWGGPEHGGHDTRMREMPTAEGRFVIGAIEAYHTRTWTASQIPWGTPLRDAPQFDDVLYQTAVGKWDSVKKLGMTRLQVREAYYQLWKRFEVPPTWVFNDSAQSRFATSGT